MNIVLKAKMILRGKKRWQLLIVLLLAFVQLSAQQAELYFPYFAGREYDFYIFRGNIQDTISTGTIGADGRVTLFLPDSLKSYRGMTRWLLKKGGGLDMIFADRENFTVSCTQEEPTAANIIYNNSPENEFLNSNYSKQQAIFNKVNALTVAVQAYTSSPDLPTRERESVEDHDELLVVFKTELEKQQKAFANLRAENDRTNLYAARFRRISDFLLGIGSKLPGSEKEHIEDMNYLVVNQLNLTDLWTSGHWDSLIEGWMDMQVNAVRNDTVLLNNVKTILHRTKDNQIYSAYCEKLIQLLSKYGKDWIIVDIAKEIKKSGQLVNPSPFLSRITAAQSGDQAPNIEGYGHVLKGQPTILAFHDSGCGNCLEQMKQLMKIYPRLRQKGYKVISISADTDKNYFEDTCVNYPWKDKLCDLKGFAGSNFLRYGILGTPTFVLIDKNGIIQNRYARVEDLMQL